MLLAIYFAMTALAVQCKTDGDHAATCASGKCEVVGSTEVCTQCKAGGVPVDGLCRPSSSPQAIAAGCTGRDGAALTDSSTACGMCSGSGFFLFRGGCYSTKSTSGSKICTAVSNGECTTCAAADWLFTNPTNPLTTPGTKCILCSDATGDGTTKGVENCQTCTAPGSAGPATCNKCQDGYYTNKQACTKCHTDCATCSGGANNQCTSCPEGKYLKDGNTCVEEGGCTQNTYYLDKVNRKCLACSTAITGCTECELDDTTGKPKCTKCGDGQTNIPRTALDGTSTCVAKGYTECQGDNKELFMKEDKTACLLCGDDSDGDDKNKGTPNCKTCTKTSAGAKPVCNTCKEGYYLDSDGSCKVCTGANCATCSKDDPNKCSTCKSGYFKQTSDPGTCTPCDNADIGIPGCAACTFSTSLTCSSCKPNYKQSESSPVTCTKVCEDPTACGGTAESCGAIVVGASGEMTYYCSLCGGSNQYPIDGICNNVKGSNQCSKGVCTQCTDGYFLYMGGCYKVDTAPGSLMCTAAAGGICTTPTGQYFKVPGASNQNQSVLRCGSSSGTTTGTGSDAKAYVGVEDCKTCTAPSEAPSGAMAPARCTACGGGKKPSLLGSGCFTCAMDGCSHCSVDGVCEACTSAEQRPSTDGKQCIPCNISGCTRCSEASKCSQCGDGYRLEGDTCVSTGGNLSSGAIAGISVAAVVVVGGLVGFLCWWFVCRGKA